MKRFASLLAVWMLLLLGVVPVAAQADEAPREAGPRLAEGIVFKDIDGTGVRDADDPPLPGIRISDGVAQVVVTDEDGAYRLELDPDSEFVIVTLPGDYEAVGSFFHRIDHEAEGAVLRADFALRPVPDPGHFRFLIFSDVHVRQDPRRAEVVADLLENTAALKPRFAANTGDIAHDSTEEQYKLYLQAVERAATFPVHHVPGNHDQKPAFTRVLGPRNYSFQRGGIHFVVVDGDRPEQMQRWLAADLPHVPEDDKLIAFSHYQLTFGGGRSPLRAMEPRKDDILATFHGHGHRWADAIIGGVRHYMCAAVGGGFYIVEVNDRALVTVDRAGLVGAREPEQRWDDIRRLYPPIPARPEQPDIEQDAAPTEPRPRVAEGIVFNDIDGTGVRDPDDPPLAGVRVSDGVARVAVTDEDGAYRLELDPDSEFVFVTLPGDYEPVGSFFHRIDREADGDVFKADFALRPAPDPDHFRFLVFNGVQFGLRADGRPAGRGMIWADMLEHTAALKPRFMVNTGDITLYGMEEQYREYLQLIDQAAVCPIHHASSSYDQTSAFTRVLGPRNYSFRRGGIHFMVTDSANPQHRWVAADLTNVPADHKVVVFSHYPLARLLASDARDARKDDILAVFYGHGASFAETTLHGVPHYQCIPIRSGRSGGFYVVEVKDGALAAVEPVAQPASRGARDWDEVRKRYPPIPDDEK